MSDLVRAHGPLLCKSQHRKEVSQLDASPPKSPEERPFLQNSLLCSCRISLGRCGSYSSPLVRSDKGETRCFVFCGWFERSARGFGDSDRSYVSSHALLSFGMRRRDPQNAQNVKDPGNRAGFVYSDADVCRWSSFAWRSKAARRKSLHTRVANNRDVRLRKSTGPPLPTRRGRRRRRRKKKKERREIGTEERGERRKKKEEVGDWGRNNQHPTRPQERGGRREGIGKPQPLAGAQE
mmetsp:Transcript_26524/g.67956  ORF Transcript_26524/g.67956 Transcript_26524/m.67956 type:complete len:237 (+) Transcript_26524:3047-3757(+)